MEEVQSSKRSRIGNGCGSGGGSHLESASAATMGQKEEQQNHQDDDDEDGEGKSGGAAGVARLHSWNQHSTASRICRVSRASGGKDRHSKVFTAKGLRDRRVRLSVSTAIQFYDLQDRLGYDQPSKAVEWLIKAAAAAIAELPSLDGVFPDPPQHAAEEKPRKTPRLLEDAAVTAEAAEENHIREQQQQQRHHHSLSKSACSSTSETSKGSVSRSEIRARERSAKDKEPDKEREDDAHIATAVHQSSMNPTPTSQSSFTELLTGTHHGQTHNHYVAVAQTNPAGPNFIHKQPRHQPPSTAATATATADYFTQVGLFSPGHKPHLQPLVFPAQPHHFASSSPTGMVPFATAVGDHPELQQFSFLPDHLIPVAAVAGGDYNINFSISSGLAAGFNRGTLQSNSPSPMPHHHVQRLSSPVDGSNLPFFFGAATTQAPASSASADSHQFPAGFDARLQLCYGDGYRQSDPKGKGKR